jgi:glycosidase
MQEKSNNHKIVIYQVFTRLFGNKNTTNKPWGTIENNGVGKFEDFTDKALQELFKLGITHIWFTGVLHHAVITDYTKYGISNDFPAIVKGRAGSPYAVKDYYNVNPDLAINPTKRLEEFEALIERAHKNNLQVIIDIVPNHVARNYIGLTNPKGVEDFGASDNTSVEYDRNNNFYYIPGKNFQVPKWKDGYTPLGGEPLPDKHAIYTEFPAKWTGNGSRSAQPDFYDWYETVKINYGIKPDGSFDFDILPNEYSDKTAKEHFEFWENKDVPNSWKKFRDIALYWMDKGVDGFRYDMAELVPIEFWSYLNASIKNKNTKALLLAEVYQPHLYRAYLHKGKMDYLYDKVDLYDTLKNIIQGHESTDNIAKIQNNLADIEHQMLHFLENHDEQRIACPEFAGNAEKGKPMLVISATISTSPTMIYFGQEVGEPAKENPGFGSASRTSIFDYCGVPKHQAWMNEGKFDGGLLRSQEKALRDFYQGLLNFTKNSPALFGKYHEIHTYNRQHTEWYNDKVFSFVRWSDEERLLIISNFSSTDTFGFELQLTPEIINIWRLLDGNYPLKDILYDEKSFLLKKQNGKTSVRIDINPLESFILSLEV